MNEFKVGDRVKHAEKDYISYFYMYDPDEIGYVSAVDFKSRYPISVDWPHPTGEYYPHLIEEIVPYVPEEN